MVVAARATRRKQSAQGLDRFLYFITLVPGGDDWMNGTEKLLAQAGIRAQERARALLHFRAAVRVRAGRGHRLPAARQSQRPRLADRRPGGAFLLGFMLPKQMLYRLVKRYRAKLQEALPDTVDLLGIVLGTGLGARPGHDARQRGDAVHLSGTGQRIRHRGHAGARRPGARQELQAVRAPHRHRGHQDRWRR